MFKKFFNWVKFNITLPFKSDADLENIKEYYPKHVKVAKVIKGIFATISAYMALYDFNKFLMLFGKGWKKFPDIGKIILNIFSKGAKVAAVA